MANILLVDDSTEIRDAVQAVLGNDHRLTWAANLEDAQKLLAAPESEWDLVLLDIGLPDGDGTDYLAKVKDELESRNIGTIFLSGSDTVTSRTKGFSLGALDFIAKPFDLIEFQVRVGAKLKGRKEVVRAPIENTLRRGPLEIHLSRQQAFDTSETEPRQLDLTPVEFRLLLLFVQNGGDVVSRAKILDTVWGQTAHVSARCVDHHVCGLRKKISRSGGRIESVYGVGYRIDI
jgi:two-component system response regulator TctD